MLAAALLGGWTAGATAQTVRVSVPGENFRKEPRVTSNNKLATVLEGTRLEAKGRQGRWLRVTLEGWIWTPSVGATDREGFDLVVDKAGGENLRESPDRQARRAAVLLRGMLLDSLERRGSWTRVRRTAWMWEESLTDVTAAAPAEPAPAVPAASDSAAPEAGGRPSAGPAGRIVSRSAVRLHVSPDGDTVATVPAGTDLEVLAREGGWARVRLEGWVWEAATLPADSAAESAVLTATDVRANPEQYVGRRVQWRVQFVSLERAEAVRSDFYEGEPFILARAEDRSEGFVYIAVPPELVIQVEDLRPLQTLDLLARVRTGRSALMGVPILDLIAIQ
jgi:hypothetical protein